MQEQRSLNFGSFRFDLKDERLWRGQEVMRLRHKALAVLRCLVGQPGQLVTKDTLFAEVWPETVVSESVLVVAIRELHRVLNDPARTPTYIETVHRRGYRFIAPVEWTPNPGAADQHQMGQHDDRADVKTQNEPKAVEPIVEPDQPAYVQTRSIEAPGPDAAERRQLTIMFCDLVDSTSLSGELDPEDLREIILAYQSVCTEVIKRYDGHVAQLLGDGLLVYFGYPQAHEDDAQRAVRTGLGILDAIGTLNTRLDQEQGINLAVRLGIHTGLVVVGDMGAEGRQERLALGEAPNLAARLQGLAEPHTVVMSAETYRLTQGFFDCEPLGEYDVRGVTQPLTVYRVLGADGAQSWLDVARIRGLTPLVGRDSELTLLLERWGQVKEGQGQVVLLSGEAGIGKSRLAQVLINHIAQAPHTRLECRSSPYFTNSSLYPVTNMLQRTLHWQPDDTPEERLEKLEQGLSRYRLPLEASVPLLAPLLSLSTPAHRYPPLNLSPPQQRQRTLETMVSLLLGLAQQQPVLFMIEDLHWTDPTTLEWLDLLLDQTPTASLMVLLTCRPTFEPAWHHRSYLTEVTVSRLSRYQSARMAEQVVGGKGLPAAVVEQLVDKSDGVPLYVEEMTKALLGSGHLKEVDEHYALTGAVASLSIPATLQDSLMARLDRLVTAKAVAQYASVIGRQFSYDLLQAVSQLDETLLQHELRRLVKAELLYQQGFPPQATYIFKHALVQEAAYASLLKSTRQQLHTHIATVLEARFPEMGETEPEVLARHYTEAGLPAQAILYWQGAAKRALARSAHREAVGSFEQALRALAQLPETRVTREQAIDLRLALRSALYPSGDAGRILACLHEAELLAEALGDPRRLAQICVLLSNHFYHEGAYDQAIATAQRALMLATASGEVVLHARANLRLGRVYLAQSEYRQAIDYLGQTVTSLDGARRLERFGQANLPAVTSRANLAWCHAELGMFAKGRALSEEGLRIAEAAAHPASLMFASYGLGLLSLLQGDLPEALPRLERAMGICQDADLPGWFPRMAAPLGAAYTLAGRVADAVPLLTQAMTQTTATERVDFQALCGLPLGEAQLLAGHLEEAHTLAEQALVHARAHGERGHQAYALRLLGEIAARREPPESERAVVHYQRALALAEELGMRPLLAHCHLGLGKLYATIGHRAEARATLSTAVELYRAMQMTWWLPETEAVLAQVEGR